MSDDDYSLEPENTDKKPAEKVVTKEEPKEVPAVTVKDKVDNVLKSMVKKDDGTWEIPEDVAKDVDESILYAATTERRYRDTQASYTSSRQKLKALEVTNTELTDHIIKNATLHLTQEQQEELEDLRVNDPEAWRTKLNEHEETAREIQKGKVDEFSKKGKEVSEAERRQTAYNEFTERTGIELSDSVLENQVPASYPKKLAEGEWTFDEFLSHVETFLSPKKIEGAGKGKVEDNPKDMSKLPGGQAPSQEAQEGDSNQSYENEIF